MGAEYLDDVLVYEFNNTVEIFNVNMRDASRASSMVKIAPSLLTLFNNRGYPRINYNTYELEWYVTKEMYNGYSKKFLNEQITEAVKNSNDQETGD